jgi:ABC-2 type transport system ATP-binding protein
MESIQPVIEISNLHKSYSNNQVLKGISLQVYPGQIIGYIGPNGAGKSTTVKIICGLLSNFEGEVKVKGISIKENPLAVKRMIGYVPELAELYEVLTPHEFLSFMADLYEIPRQQAEERFTKMLTAFGLSNNLHQRMETFSKGMRQKVLIVSGLMHNPEVIILDEPLSGLDANSVIIVKELLSKLAAAGKTIFYSSHMMDVVEKISDRIILINNGVIAADGSIEELREQKGNLSLEKIFANITSLGAHSDAVDEIMDAFDFITEPKESAI